MSTEKELHRQAVEETAADLAKHGTPAINAALSGGKSTAQLSSEDAHRVAAAIARDQEKGHVRPTAEYIRETKRR